MKAELFYKSNNVLGEGAMCHPSQQRLYWVDIVGRKLMSISQNGSGFRAYAMPSMPSTVVPADGKGVIVTLTDGIAHFDTAKNTLTPLVSVEANLPQNRFNDGKCDPEGRLWFGSMHLEGKSGAGKLYSYGAKQGVQIRLDHQSVPNGIVWHGQKMYYIDTADRCIREFGFDAETGTISSERIAVTISEALGSPDGMAVDSNGMLWVALWGGGAVGCWDPKTGRLIEKVEVDVPLVTSCAFGGPELRSLFITTARYAMTPDELIASPLSGSVFVCHEMPCCGIAPNCFKP